MTINDSRRISMELLTSNGCSNEDNNNNNMLESTIIEVSAAFVLANQGVGRRITNDITSYQYENIKNNIHYPISKTKSKGRKIKRSRKIYARQH